ncbi:MAG: diguanylate cyclase [Magnetococcales bacterium]|nr:diguanylate cyclase [Magnetococcales bacterium]MBF0156590.1 diguanylate cyclase [Magnetococcales bacterium]
MTILPQRIGSKILGLVGAVFLLSLVGMVVFYTGRQEATILEQHAASMGDLTDSVVNGLGTIMLAGYADIAQAYAASQKKSGSLREFHILRTDGREAFLDNETIRQVNRRIGEEEFLPRESESEERVLLESSPELRQAVEGTRKVEYRRQVGGETLLTYLVPIANRKECHRCHGGAQALRGVILLSASLERAIEAIRVTRVQAVQILAVSFLGSLFSVWLLIRLSIIRPVNRVTGAMARVSKGNLSQEVPVIGEDELAVMARNFNFMMAQVVKSHRDLSQERNKLTTIILSAEEGIVVSDATGAVVLVNPAAERLLDKSSEEIVADGFLNVVDDVEYVSAFLERQGADLPKTLVYKGRILHFHAAAISSEEGSHIGSASLIRDVTEEKKLEEQLRAMSFTDKLTGIFNRRHMEDVLGKEYSRSQRYGTELSILFFDVDHFKKFNDTYGHDMGDRVLVEIGRTAKEAFRVPDVPCRYGGEEFCIILPNTGSRGAYAAAEAFRKRIEQMPVDGVHVTVSIGVATLPDAGSESPEAFLKAADTALYEGKRAGRNRVILWEDVRQQGGEKTGK